MKKILFALVASVAFVGCTNDETLVANRQEITFGKVFVDKATRADYSDGQNLEQFLVYGTVTGTAGTVNIFEDVPVTGEVGEDVWEYDEQYNQYWIPDAGYNFAAVVDADVVGKDNTNKMPITLTSNADATTGVRKDLLYAEGQVVKAAADQDPVNFTFNHLLSKVHFTVTSNATGGYSHTVTNISVANFKTGVFTLDNAITPGTIDGGTWTGSEPMNIPFAEIAGVTIAETDGISNADMLIMPNAAEYLVNFTVDLYKGNTKLGTETKNITVTTPLVKGNAYNFTIECEVGNPIQFKVTNDPTWSDEQDVTIQ